MKTSKRSDFKNITFESISFLLSSATFRARALLSTQKKCLIDEFFSIDIGMIPEPVQTSINTEKSVSFDVFIDSLTNDSVSSLGTRVFLL
jgi:hypothetical protein